MKVTFLRGQQRETKAHTPARIMELWTTAKAECDAWVAAGGKIKKGAEPEDAGITADMMSIYGKIAGRYSLNLQVGLSRFPYEPVVPGINLFQGGFFRNTQWKPRMELQRAQASMHSIWNYEMNYINATGYWLGLQATFFR